jgi:hypothetical protein
LRFLRQGVRQTQIVQSMMKALGPFDACREGPAASQMCADCRVVNDVRDEVSVMKLGNF